MVSFLSFAVLAYTFFIPCLADGLPYYVHPTCVHNDSGVQEAIEEAVLMAQRSVARLDTKDPDIRKVFWYTFGADISRRTSNIPMRKVRKIMKGIGDMKGVETMQDSVVRIICDHDKRWKPPPEDMKLQKDKLGNDLPDWSQDSLKPSDERALIDAEQLKDGTLDTEPWRLNFGHKRVCHERGSIAMYTLTYHGSIPKFGKGRADVTICSPFDRAPVTTLRKLMTIPDFDIVRDTTLVGSRDSPPTAMAPTALMSFMLLHELTHLVDFDREDVPEPDPYGWQHIIHMSLESRLLNADNYAFLGLLALLGDYRVKLDGDQRRAKGGYLVNTDYDFGFRP
ncbi:hypothetical protein EJ05DRAFT_192258 [Pseudovirgaria hyperparasitica]|uniref:Lysine-specific metallo-endopeptidase domain-containing protein n=1 Tax=Pseudovirgaria hyperparasitica TaxID=470096 RepID=A0A6A6WIS8_9PEZI|nr:uncharacterized protein EJ05DRAFT_192258 [Pseudovirgaria hyperparasitica]KAF2761986.1 hypothetical protein EJ05DRAFT_192258 [Pseudovirgaria hyperparasitica]